MTSARELRLDRTSRWLVYSVLFGGFPIFALVLRSGDLSVKQVIGQGDLLMLGAALSAAAIGEALGVEHVRRIIRNLLVGACLLTLTASSLVFALALGETGAQDVRAAGFVQSLVFFVLNAVSAGVTIWVTGEPERSASTDGA